MPINPVSPGEYTNQYDLQQMRNNQQNANNLADFLNQAALSKQGAAQKEQAAEAAFGRTQQQQAKNVQTVMQLEKEMNAGRGPYGGRTSFSIDGNGGVAAQESQPNVMALMYGMQGKGNKAIADAAKAQGFEGMTTRMQQLDNMVKSLSDGNSFGDAAASLMEHLSLAGPGGTRALGTILREAGLPTDNIQSAISEAMNKIRGGSDPVFNQKIRDAMIQYAQSQADLTHTNFESAKTHLNQAIPSIAPFSPNPDAVTGIYTGPGEDAYNQIQNDVQAYKQPKQPNLGVSQLPTTAPTTVGDSVVNSVLHPVNTLESWLKGPQQQQPTTSMQQPAGPSSGSSLVRVQNQQGQTGTIDLNNPQDAADLQAGKYKRIQ